MRILLLYFLSVSLVLAEVQFGDLPIVDNDGDYISVYIVEKPTKFYREKECINESSSVEFGTNFYVYDKSEDSYYIGKSLDGDDRLIKKIGWIKQECILQNKVALKNSYGISRKIVVSFPEGKADVPAYFSPFSEEVKQNCPFFSFYYLFKEKEIATQKDNYKTFYLLAKSEFMTDPKTEIIGWIESSNCKDWDTKEATGANKKTYHERIQYEEKGHKGLMRIYSSIENLLLSTSNDKIQPIAIEPKNSEKTPIYMMRNPALATYYVYGSYHDLENGNIDNLDYEQEYIETRKKDILGKFVEIGFLAQGKGRKFDRNKFEKYLQQKIDNANNLDIMFVVDQTGSMKNYATEVKKAFDEAFSLNKNMPKALEPSIHWGVTFYSDFDPSVKEECASDEINENVIYFENFTASQKDFQEIFYQGVKDSMLGWDRRESLFYGINIAVRHAKWREGSKRIIIVIGDDGNHRSDIPSLSHQVVLSESEIIDTLGDYGVDLIGIQVPNSNKVELVDGYKDFKIQMKTLIQGVKKNKQTGIFIANKNSKDLQKDKNNQGRVFLDGWIRKMIKINIKKADIYQKVLFDLQKGSTLASLRKNYKNKFKELYDELYSQNESESEEEKATKNETKNEIVIEAPDPFEIIKEGLEKEGFDPEDVEKFANVGKFSKGYAWFTNPELKQANLSQITEEYLVDENDFSALVGFLHTAAKNCVGKKAPRRIKATWINMLEELTGDEIDPFEPINKIMQKNIGLPFRSELLKISIDDISKKLKEPKFRRKIRNLLEQKHDNLLDILKNRERIPGKDKKVERKWWWWDRHSYRKYTWLPVDRLP